MVGESEVEDKEEDNEINLNLKKKKEVIKKIKIPKLQNPEASSSKRTSPTPPPQPPKALSEKQKKRKKKQLDKLEEEEVARTADAKEEAAALKKANFKPRVVVPSNISGLEKPLIIELLPFHINQLMTSSDFLQVQEIKDSFVDSLAQELIEYPYSMKSQVFSVLLT